MPTATIHFRPHSPSELALGPGECHYAGEANRAALPAGEVARAVARALAAPHDHPPIAQSVLSGDQVVVAVGPSVPQVELVLDGVLATLVAADVAPANLVVLVASQDDFASIAAHASRHWPEAVRVVKHDPEHTESLCMLGTTAEDQPLAMARVLVDADVVVPVAVARPAAAVGDRGVFAGLYPYFGDQAAIDRFARGDGLQAVANGVLRQQTLSAGRLLGPSSVLLVVPARAGGIAAVVAGSPDAAIAESQQLAATEWQVPAGVVADLAIAVLTSDQSQTWPAVARAIATARRLVGPQGAIALCTRLAERPGRALGALLDGGSRGALRVKLAAEHSSDAQAAYQIASWTERHPLYFMSQLEDELVEELGLAPITGFDQIVRLASRSASCVVLDQCEYMAVAKQRSTTTGRTTHRSRRK